jgi:urea transport system substrate-binding protein
VLPNHHITKPVFIGEVKGDGQFNVVWKTPGLVPGADWVTLKCGNYNKVTKKCGGSS